MHRLLWQLALLFGLLMTPLTGAAQPTQPLKVKELTEQLSGSKSLEGVVDKIDKDGMTLLETVKPWAGTRVGRKPPKLSDPPPVEAGAKPEVKEHRIVPIDLLRDGGVLPKVFGANAYRWQDVKVGDRVVIEVMEDKADKVVYCTEICISRRPGEKLPQSQNPTTDHRYPGARIFNDIDNGQDVSDEDIAKAFKPGTYRDPKTAQQVPVPVSKDSPYFKYMEKLEAIRAKKKEQEKDLKATPPDKK